MRDFDCNRLLRDLTLTTSGEQKSRIQIWLYEQADLRIEGQIIVRCLLFSWLVALSVARLGIPEFS